MIFGNAPRFSTHKFSVSLQNTSVSPDDKLLAVLGDSPECLLADAQSGKVGFAHISFIKT